MRLKVQENKRNKQLLVFLQRKKLDFLKNGKTPKFVTIDEENLEF